VRVVAPAGADAATLAACSSSAERTGHVLATAYVLKGQHTLVSIASWSNLTASCELQVDWAALGLPLPTAVKTQAIGGFQNETSFAVDQASGRVKSVTTAPAGGWLLVLGTDIPGPPPTPPPENFRWQNISKGAPGCSSSCPSTAASCIFDAEYCVRKFGQCAMLETQAQAHCGAWGLSDGVVCKAAYGGYCLARAKIDAEANVEMWGLRKAPK